MLEKIGSSCVIGVNKSALSFKTKEEQLNYEAAKVVTKIKKRFPLMNYVGVPHFKEVEGTKQIGEIHMFRTIPQLTSSLIFFDFNTIMTRHVDFCVGFLLGIDIAKRGQALLRLA